MTIQIHSFTLSFVALPHTSSTRQPTTSNQSHYIEICQTSVNACSPPYSRSLVPWSTECHRPWPLTVGGTMALIHSQGPSPTISCWAFSRSDHQPPLGGAPRSLLLPATAPSSFQSPSLTHWTPSQLLGWTPQSLIPGLRLSIPGSPGRSLIGLNFGPLLI